MFGLSKQPIIDLSASNRFAILTVIAKKTASLIRNENTNVHLFVLPSMQKNYDAIGMECELID